VNIGLVNKIALMRHKVDINAEGHAVADNFPASKGSRHVLRVERIAYSSFCRAR
jgi:hypothetical protein